EPIEAYSTGKVLTMERVHGTKVDKLSPLVRTDLGGRELAEQLLGAYLHQILVDGFFHADPHPGNVLLTHNRRVALIDLGMIGHIASSLQETLMRLLVALTDGHGDEVADLVANMGSPRPDFDRQLFRRRISELVAEQREVSIQRLQVGKVVLELVTHANSAGVRVPTELTLLGKTLLNLDQVVRALDPDLDVTAALRQKLASMIRKRMLHAATPG